MDGGGIGGGEIEEGGGYRSKGREGEERSGIGKGRMSVGVRGVIVVGKYSFFESDITRNMNLMGVKIIDTIDSIVRRIAEKNIGSSTREKFVMVRKDSLRII